MRSLLRTVLAGGLSVGVAQALVASSAHAQGYADRGSLGGYGSIMGSPLEGMTTTGSVVPYAGRFGGFMPSRMDGWREELAFERRSSSRTAPILGSFILSPMPGAMSAMSSGIRQGPVSRAGMSSSAGLRGGMGSNMEMRRTVPGATGVMPPRIGYPFRQPPSLVGPATGSGMSM